MFTCITIRVLNDYLILFKAEKSKALNKRVHIPQVRDNNVAINTSRTPEGLRRIRGTHGTFLHASEWLGGRQSYNSLAVPLGYNGSNELKLTLYYARLRMTINVIYY